ncbi:hypothetical protein GCM10009107_41820 [Ideonella azotifigens]|uniref:3-carboxymuconate cyclase n=2 Tax=Ideonella azotifigens TaxID=513160 RepID=A0ABN1KA77_9BURK
MFNRIPRFLLEINMTVSRRTLSAIGLAISAFASTGAMADTVSVPGLHSHKVFTSSNAAEGNELMVLAPSATGELGVVAHTSTGGLGLGKGLGSQGAVTLSGDGQYALVVNAGNNTVSVFTLGDDMLTLSATVDSAGLTPISVTEHEGQVYVLNSGGAGNVAGFMLADGQLTPVAGAVAPLSVASGAAPAQVSFTADGKALVVTEKGTNKLSSYHVHGDSSLKGPIVTNSPGQTPFGFAVSPSNVMVVSEAVGGAAGASTVSSYRFKDGSPAVPRVMSAAVPDTQSAACWVAITPSGKWAYVANTGSSSVSSYRIDQKGRITLSAAVAGNTGSGTAPADLTVAADGQHLYVRNGGVPGIANFVIGKGGVLSAGTSFTGLSAIATGLAAN